MRVRLDGIVLCIAEDIHTKLSSEVVLGKCYARLLILMCCGWRLKNDVNLRISLCFSYMFICTEIAFEIWCISRVLLVVGSRLKNEAYIHVSLSLSSVFIFTTCCTCLLRRKCKRSRLTITIKRCNCRMETLLVRSWIKLDIRRIERIGWIDKLARGHSH